MSGPDVSRAAECLARGGPADPAVPRVHRGAARRGARPRDGDRQCARAARPRGRPVARRGAAGQRPARYPARRRPGKQLLVLPAALRRDAGGPALGVSPPLPPLPHRTQRPGGRVGPRHRRLRAVPRGTAADAVGLRRHPGCHSGSRLVGRGRQRPRGPWRPDQRARGDAVVSRGVGTVVRGDGAAVRVAALGARVRRRLPGRHDGRGGGYGQPLPTRRGGWRGGHHYRGFGRPRAPPATRRDHSSSALVVARVA